MWIRSQSKYTLINTNTIRICADDTDNCDDYLICAFQDGYDHELGTYSTFEKALIVLDEIQSVIMNNQLCVIDKAPRGSYVLNKGAQVYQMPQDEDVKL